MPFKNFAHNRKYKLKYKYVFSLGGKFCLFFLWLFFVSGHDHLEYRLKLDIFLFDCLLSNLNIEIKRSVYGMCHTCSQLELIFRAANIFIMMSTQQNISENCMRYHSWHKWQSETLLAASPADDARDFQHAGSPMPRTDVNGKKKWDVKTVVFSCRWEVTCWDSLVLSSVWVT